MATTAEKIRERRLDRMRLGQAVCDYVTLISDSEVRLCIVPLTEAQFKQVLQKVNEIVADDNLAGMQVRDRIQCQEIIVRAVREEADLTQRVWTDVDEMMEVLDQLDVDELIDRYNEMIAVSSPSLDGIPDEELENLKKLLQTMDWSVLSGRAWYAAKRFLSEIMPTPLLDNSPGFGSTSLLTTQSESEESTPTV